MSGGLIRLTDVIKKHETDENRVVVETIIPEKTVRQSFRIAELEKKLNHLNNVIPNLTAERDMLQNVLDQAVSLGVVDDRV
jgi:hypothetical protein